jgi:hypothetical protein
MIVSLEEGWVKLEEVWMELRAAGVVSRRI